MILNEARMVHQILYLLKVMLFFGYAEAKDIDVDFGKTAKGSKVKRYLGTLT